MSGEVPVLNELRDVERVVATQPAGRNAIAVIGIDRYHHWPRLSNAVCDATGAATTFKRLGFEEVTEALLDERATGKAVHELVSDDLMALGPYDNLVLFYAGHGGTRRHRLGQQEIKTGYLVPVDAVDSPSKVSTWIELDSWLRAVALLPAKHILVMLDACHSGIALHTVLKWRDVTSSQAEPLSTLNARRSRRIITSGLDDQATLDSGPIHGHSLFTGCMIEGLTHGVRRSASQWITGSELGLYIQRRVEAYPGSRQTPDFGSFAFDDRGEMVIPLPPEACEDAIDVRSSERQQRTKRMLLDAFERWVEHDRGERQLLDFDIVLEVMTQPTSTILAQELVEFLDQSAARQVAEHEEHVATLLEFMQRTETLESASVRFARLLRHPSWHIRMGAVRVAQRYDREIATQVFQDHVTMERLPDIRRVIVRYLWREGIIPSREHADAILRREPDWMTAAWAIGGVPGKPTVLLICDGSDFARDMAGLLESANFCVVNELNDSSLLSDRLDPDVLNIFSAIVLIRGENYHRTYFNTNYEAIVKYVESGGVLFATPWVAWEMVQWPCARVLPFFYRGGRLTEGGTNEGVTLQAHPAQTKLAQELFNEPFVFEISYEELQPHFDTKVLLFGRDDIPLYGFRRIKNGECHYLNVCQHHCGRSMQSPLRVAPFAEGMERVWRWLAKRCSGRRVVSSVRDNGT